MKPTLLSFLEHGSQPYVAHVTDRLPAHILAPCTIKSEWTLTLHSDFYLLSMTLQGEMQIQCQRCAQAFDFFYQHEFQIALFKHDTQLKQHLASYDCVLISELPKTLLELITDELHLSSPEKHIECGLEG